MKKLLSLILAICMLLSVSAALAEKIEVETEYTDSQLETLKEIVDAFSAETGIEVDLVTPGSDYETVMKTRMASEDLPDVWGTHGWSVRRYHEFLHALNDEPWLSRMDQSATDIVTDADGKVCAACITLTMGGCIYNKDVLDEAGVDPAQIRSLQDFYDACEKIKATGKIPVMVGGKDSGNAAGFLAAIMPALVCDAGSKYDLGATLLDGTFDWDKYGTEIFGEIAKMVNNGYINTNFTTADTQAQCETIANNEAGFLWRHTQMITTALKYNPDANLGFMPYPSYSGEAMTYKSGEGMAFGIWKDTEHYEAAAKFVEYVTRKENVEKIALALGSLPAFTDATVEGDKAIEAFRVSQGQFADVGKYTNVFDRQYFPNGMWGIMGESVTMVVMDPTDAGIAAAVENMKTNYLDKFEADGN